MDGFLTRFVRRDGKPAEEYYYRSNEEAEDHQKLFKDDDSGLYARVEVINIKVMKQTAVLNYY